MSRQKRNKRNSAWTYNYVFGHPLIISYLAVAHKHRLDEICAKYNATLEAPGFDLGVGKTLTLVCSTKPILDKAIDELDEVISDVHGYVETMTIPKSATRTIQKMRQLAVLLDFGKLCRTWIVVGEAEDDRMMTVEISMAGSLSAITQWERLLDAFCKALEPDANCNIGVSLDSLMKYSNFVLDADRDLLDRFDQALLTPVARSLNFSMNSALDVCMTEYRLKVECDLD
jgi:hypothetical protein